MRRHMLCAAALALYAALLAACALGDGCAHEETRYVLRAPDCARAGIALHVCALCGEKRCETLPPRHTYPAQPDVTVQNTCARPGGEVRYCAVCNPGHDPLAEGVACALLPAAHLWGDAPVYVPPACETGGFYARVCARCGARETLHAEEAAPALGHASQRETLTAPACGRAGAARTVCARCGKVLEADIALPALSHDYVDTGASLPADCLRPQRAIFACALCGARETRVLPDAAPALGHAVAYRLWEGAGDGCLYLRAYCLRCEALLSLERLACLPGGASAEGGGI